MEAVRSLPPICFSPRPPTATKIGAHPSNRSASQLSLRPARCKHLAGSNAAYQCRDQASNLPKANGRIVALDKTRTF